MTESADSSGEGQTSSFFARLNNRARALGVFGWKRNVLAGLVVAVGAAAIALAIGAYPIAFVNGSPLFARRFDHAYTAAAASYEQLVRNIPAGDQGKVKKLGRREIEAGVLDELVSASLIARAVRREVGGDLDAMIAERTLKYRDDARVREGVGKIYGMSYDDFERGVLVPQAEEDILAGRLFLRGEKIEPWLRDARRSADVSIFSNRFRWDGEKVAAGE